MLQRKKENTEELDIKYMPEEDKNLKNKAKVIKTQKNCITYILVAHIVKDE